MNTTALDIFAIITLLVIGVAMPLLGVWDFRRLLAAVAAGRADARFKAYTWTLIMEWALVAIFAGWWLFNGRGLAPIGLLPTAAGWQWLANGLGIAATVIVIWQMFTVIKSPKELAKARKAMGDLGTLAPQTAADKKMFAAVAISAGICEEIVYRGVLLAVLTPLIGLWPAVGVSSLIFGLAHTYQGLFGIVKTGFIGLIFTLLVIYSGSLFVAMLLHAVVDLTSGRVMSVALAAEPEPEMSPTST